MITAHMVDNVINKATKEAWKQPNNDLPFKIRVKQMFLNEVSEKFTDKPVYITNEVLIKLSKFVSLKDLLATLNKSGCTDVYA